MSATMVVAEIKAALRCRNKVRAVQLWIPLAPAFGGWAVVGRRAAMTFLETCHPSAHIAASISGDGLLSIGLVVVPS